MSATGVAIVGAFFAAFGAGDVPKAMSLLGPEVRWTLHAKDVPWGGTFKGPKGVGDFFATFGTHAEPIEMTPKSMVEADGLVYVRGIERSKVKATGKEYSVEWVHVISTADGKIATFDEYLDSAAIAAALR
ncbi:MAG: nuclear transport factor 2 family protein [Pseudomonadota bacterium]